MKSFYKINHDGTAQLKIAASADPEWFEYTAGDEPPDLKAALENDAIDEAANNKRREIARKAQAFVESHVPSYPYFETLTFDRQESEARAYLSDSGAETPTLSEIAAARGIAVDDLAARVVEKADKFNFVASAAAGQRQAYDDELSQALDAGDVDAINAINVTYSLN